MVEPMVNRKSAMVVQIIVSAVILLSGIGIGVGGTILALRDRIIWKFPPPPPDGGDRRMDPNGIARRWQEEYGLNDEQVEQVKEIFTRQFTAMREVFNKLQVEERAQREQFATAMKEILKPEQFEKWEKEFRERGERWRRMRPFGRPGSGPGPGPGRHGPPGPSPRDGKRPDQWRDHPDGGPREMRTPWPRPDGPPESDAPSPDTAPAPQDTPTIPEN